MKKLLNMTTDRDDLNRYGNRQEFCNSISGLDGIELSYYGPDENNIIPVDSIIGYHMAMPNYWLDFYNGDYNALLTEFDSKENWEMYYHGMDGSAITKRLRDELARAAEFGSEYVVFHASDCAFIESVNFDYRHSDEEVIDAVIRMANDVFDDDSMDIKLFFENLWVPGLRFTRPDITEKLMDGINYKHKGIILDTGHLMHMNTSIRTPEDAVMHINKMLDEHGDLCDHIKAVHLNQSISGKLIESLKAAKYDFEEDFHNRHRKVFETIFKIDKHEPFTGNGVDELIRRINPEYLIFEFITSDIKQQNEYRKKQMKCLPSLF